MIELEGKRRFLYQWDLNKRVVMDSFLPGTNVEFSKRYDSKESTLIVRAYKEDGHIYANVPNSLLQNEGYIRVIVMPSANDIDHQPVMKDIRCVRREKPADYVYTETEVLNYQSLEERVDELEQRDVPEEQIKQIEQNKQDIEALAKNKLDADELPAAVNDALAQAKASGEFKGDPGEQGPAGPTGETGPVGPTGAAGRDGVDGKDGTDGKDGKDGQPGEDGFSPVVSVVDITGGHRVTITDKDGAKTFDVMDGKDGQDDSGGSGSVVQADWNENDPEAAGYVRNRTHYEVPPAFDIQWDGDMTDRFVLDMSALGFDSGLYYVKVSDIVPTVNEIVGATLTLSDGDSVAIPEDGVDNSTFPGALNIYDYLVVVFDQSLLSAALGIPDGYVTNGIYFYLYTGNGIYTTGLRSASQVVKIPDKFLPDFAAVSFTGLYSDLLKKPEIPKDLLQGAGLNLTDEEKNILSNNTGLIPRNVVLDILMGHVPALAFRDCKLESSVYNDVLYNPLIKSIGKMAFLRTSIKEINLPNLVSIDEEAFYNCIHLQKADLHNVRFIGSGAFLNSYNLDTVILRRTDVSISQSSYVFKGTSIESGSGYIYVPSALVDNYKTSWSAFASQIRAIEDYPEICG